MEMEKHSIKCTEWKRAWRFMCVCVSHLRVNKPLGMAGIKSDEGKKKNDEAKICMCSFTQQIMS